MASSQTKRSLYALTIIVVILMLANLAMGVYEIQSTLAEFKVLDAGDFTEEMAQANILRIRYLINEQLGVSLLMLVFFMIWIYRAYKNTQRQGARGLQNSAGWAVGWFFVPIANYWKPYVAMRELWQASHSPENPEEYKNYAVVLIWWVFWVVNVFLSLLVSRVVINLTTMERLQEFMTVTIISDVCRSIVMLGAIYIVVQVYRAQVAVSARMRKSSQLAAQRAQA